MDAGGPETSRILKGKEGEEVQEDVVGKDVEDARAKIILLEVRSPFRVLELNIRSLLELTIRSHSLQMRSAIL